MHALVRVLRAVAGRVQVGGAEVDLELEYVVEQRDRVAVLDALADRDEGVQPRLLALHDVDGVDGEVGDVPRDG